MEANLRLRRARLERMWTIRKVATDIQRSERTVLRWEQGTQLPQLDALAHLCSLFKMSAEELGFGKLVTVDADRMNKHSVSSDPPTMSPAGDPLRGTGTVSESAVSYTVSGTRATPSDTDPEH